MFSRHSRRSSLLSRYDDQLRTWLYSITGSDHRSVKCVRFFQKNWGGNTCLHLSKTADRFLGQTKNMCFRLPTVPKFKSSTLSFLLSFLVFYNWFFSQKSVFSFKSVFVASYIKNNFTESVFVTFARCRQHASRDQTVSQWKWSSNEPWYHVTDWKIQCRYTSSVFIKRTSGKSKIISKHKKIIRPTYPNFKKHVTGNTHIFLFGLSVIYNKNNNSFRYSSDVLLNWHVHNYGTRAPRSF